MASESVTATNPDYVRTIKSTVAKEIDGKIAIVDVYVFEEEYAGKSRIFFIAVFDSIFFNVTGERVEDQVELLNYYSPWKFTQVTTSDGSTEIVLEVNIQEAKGIKMVEMAFEDFENAIDKAITEFQK